MSWHDTVAGPVVCTPSNFELQEMQVRIALATVVYLRYVLSLSSAEFSSYISEQERVDFISPESAADMRRCQLLSQGWPRIQVSK